MKIRLFRRLHLIPAALCGLLLVGGFFSLIYIYLHGAEALASASTGEKYQMSLSYDEADNSSTGGRYRCMDAGVVLRTSDGITLSGPQAGTLDAAFYNLVGIQAGGQSRYLLDCFTQADAYGEVYSPWTGIRRSSRSQINPEVELTLCAALQEAMYRYLANQNASGSVFCYDYTTGAVLCCVSTPGCASDADQTNLAEGTLLNKCLYAAPPGSTMKLVTLLLLAAQDVDLESLCYNCSGSVTLDGNCIVCPGVHGTVDAAAAVGTSCNCWFAQAVYENLDLEKAAETLRSLGWSVNGSDARASISGVPVTPGSVTLNQRGWDFSTLWALIGETTVMASPTWMAEMAAQYLSGGEAARPCFLRGEACGAPDPAWSAYSREIQAVAAVWLRGYAQWMQDAYPAEISAAKTGTYEFDSGELQRNLVGCSESYHIAFYVTLDHYTTVSERLRVQDVAAALLDAMAELT